MSINTQFKEILENGGREVYSYSGRSMYGKKCVAFTTDGSIAQEMVQLSTEILNYCYDQIGDNDVEHLVDTVEEFFDIISEAKIDSMGLNEVIYFPNVEWFDEDDEEEFDSEDEEEGYD